MSAHRTLDFPVLQPGSANFTKDVRYAVSAENRGKKLTVTHTLKGRSFIRDWLSKGLAIFNVQLLYSGTSERQAHRCPQDKIDQSGNTLGAVQDIDIDFSYPPKVTPSIVAIQENTLLVEHPQSGLSDFWPAGERLVIPAWARIADHVPLDFTGGAINRLISIDCDDKMKDGAMKTTVLEEAAGPGDKPVRLTCARNVYDQLHKISQAEDDTGNIKALDAALRSAIITQALTAVYAYMHAAYMHPDNGESDPGDLNETLSIHLKDMQKKTGQTLEDDNFNPGLAATLMRPYVFPAPDAD